VRGPLLYPIQAREPFGLVLAASHGLRARPSRARPRAPVREIVDDGVHASYSHLDQMAAGLPACAASDRRRARQRASNVSGSSGCE